MPDPRSLRSKPTVEVRSAGHPVAELIRAHPTLHAYARVAKRARRRAFESLGLDWYSHPAYHRLDRKLAEYLTERRGTFVEAGAFDGYWGSNTYWFERFRGWSGVLIEPIPELADRARKERPRSQVFQCALVPPEYSCTRITLFFRGTASAVVGAGRSTENRARTGTDLGGEETVELDVPARVLSDVLDDASVDRIDLLSLDVEGFEPSVLRGLDLSRHRPRFLLVEMLSEAVKRPAIEATLVPHYRYEAQLSHRDHLYRLTA